MKDTIRTIKILSILIPVLITSCISENIHNPSTEKNEYTVTFSVTVPGTPIPSSRGLTLSQESFVDHVDILVFEPEGNFLYNVYTPTITENDNKRIFNISLVKGTGDLIILANARKIIDQHYPTGIPQGESREEIQKNLQLETNGKWETTGNNYQPIPMWGEYKNILIDQDCSISGIYLHRMLSKINFHVNTDREDFELTEIYLLNASSKGLVIPSPQSWDTYEDKAIQESLLPGWGRELPRLKYDATVINDNRCINEIYTFEAAPGDPANLHNTTYLIFGGKYKESDVITYYRVDFATRQEGYLPLLRNHWYEININFIAGPGAPTPDDAQNNIEYELGIQNSFIYSFFIYDDQYILGVQKEEIQREWHTENASLKIRTNHPEGWQAILSTSPDYPEAGSPDWLTVTSPTGGETGDAELTFIFDRNLETASRTAYIHLNAGHLKAIIPIIHTEYDFEITCDHNNDEAVDVTGKLITVTARGSWPTNLHIRAITQEGSISLDNNIIIAGSGEKQSSLNIPPTRSWENRFFDIQWSQDGETWTTLIQAYQLPCYISSVTMTPSSGPLSVNGGICLMTVYGHFPSGTVQVRAYSNGMNEQIMPLTEAGFNENSAIGFLIIPKNETGSNREVYFQYQRTDLLEQGEEWITHAVFIQTTSKYIKLRTGRIVALEDLPEPLGWPLAMGIPLNYYSQHFFKTYGTGTNSMNSDYPATENTGCPAYGDDTYPAGDWRLPTSIEMAEISDKYLVIGNLKNGESYWNSAENYNDNGAYMASTQIINAGSWNISIKSVGYYVRCVRRPVEGDPDY